MFGGALVHALSYVKLFELQFSPSRCLGWLIARQRTAGYGASPLAFPQQWGNPPMFSCLFLFLWALELGQSLLRRSLFRLGLCGGRELYPLLVCQIIQLILPCLPVGVTIFVFLKRGSAGKGGSTAGNVHVRVGKRGIWRGS